MALPTLADGAWEAMTDGEREQLAADVEAFGGEGLRDYMARMVPHHPPPKHLDPLIEVIEEARTTRDMKVGISMPPGHIKTTTFVHALAWWLTKFPADACAFNSYNSPKALAESAKARVLALRSGLELSDDTNSKSEWRTAEGGGLLAGGMESLTGRRVQGPLVIDDPYSGPLDAYSPAYREHVFDQIQSVAMTRREGGAPLFLVHTRWHKDDAIGRFKRLQAEGKASGWRFINLPAINDDGKALWSDVYPIEALRLIQQDVGEYIFSALYQGEPRSKGDAVFGEPHYYDPEKTDFTGTRLVLAADPAASDDTAADYSTIVVLSVRGRGATKVGYVRAVYRRQVTIPTFVQVLRAWQQEWGNTLVNVEAVAGFKAIPQMLRAIDKNLRVRGIRPLGDKFTRAQPVAAAWNGNAAAGIPPRLFIPSNSPPWLAAFIDEVTSFTGVNDATDDQVDALSHAWNSDAPASMFDAV